MTEERPVRKVQEKGEKPEKQEEKEEKSWDEKWRRDPLNAAVWALILIWLGVVLLASNFGLLDWAKLHEWWPLFFLGAGALLLLEVAVRLVMPAYRTPLRGNIILAIIFLAIGLGELLSWDLIWPFVIIGIGLAILLTGLLRKR